MPEGVRLSGLEPLAVQGRAVGTFIIHHSHGVVLQPEKQMVQMAYISEWGGQFVVPIPEVKVLAQV